MSLRGADLLTPPTHTFGRVLAGFYRVFKKAGNEFEAVKRGVKAFFQKR